MTTRTGDIGNSFSRALQLAVLALALACAHKAPPSAPVQAAPEAAPAPDAGTPVHVAFPGPEEELAVWNSNHPEAARELCQWAQHHPDAARRFFQWDAEHPDRSHELVSWTLAHPGQNLDAFLAAHRDWSDLEELARDHRPAADAFVEWVWRHPVAAERLMNHAKGLAWAGEHPAC